MSSQPLFLVRTSKDTSAAAFVCDKIEAIGFGFYPESALRCTLGNSEYTVYCSHNPTIEIVWGGERA